MADPIDISNQMKNDIVYVRWIDIDRMDDSAYAALQMVLDKNERDSMVKLMREDDRRVYVAAHALTRGMLAKIAGRDPKAWKYLTGLHGKPSPVTKIGEPDLRINISHTHGIALVAVCIGREIGVDVEWLGRRAPFEVVDQHFSNIERAVFGECPEGLRNKTFFALWTLKEAYTKAIGRGLTLSLDSFAFDIDEERLLFSNEYPDIGHWTFRRLRVSTQYMAALAVDCTELDQLNVDALPADIDQLVEIAISGLDCTYGWTGKLKI